MQISFQEIQNFLNQGILGVKKKEITFFDIAGFPSHENVISNVYAYFLNPTNDHGLGTLFLDCLQDLCDTEYVFSSPHVDREVFTKNDGRIDLVVTNPSESENKKGPALIIENKIFHTVENNLADYFDSIDADEKIGILLTLNETNPNHASFKNITHEQLLNKVLESIGPLIVTLPHQSIFYIKEFSRNLKNFTMNHEVIKYYKFYRENHAAIHQVQSLMAEISSHIWSQIHVAATLIPGLKLEVSGKYNTTHRYYYEPNIHGVMFTIVPEIFEEGEPKVKIIIELGKQGIERLDKINQINFTQEEKDIFKETDKKRGTWLHFALIEFTLLPSDVENLAEFIEDKIEKTPLRSVYDKIAAIMPKAEP